MGSYSKVCDGESDGQTGGQTDGQTSQTVHRAALELAAKNAKIILILFISIMSFIGEAAAYLPDKR